MYKKLIFLLLILPLQLFAQALQVGNLQCEYNSNPAGIESLNPKLSWILTSTGRNVEQTAYRVLVSDDQTQLNKNIGNIWDSKRVASSGSIEVTYNGKPLIAAKTYYWKVQAWDNENHNTWSSVAQWQMGLLKPSDWGNAKWIAYDKIPDAERQVPFIDNRGPKNVTSNDVLPLLRRTFPINKSIKKATLYLCGLGHFELSLNGSKVGDHFLDAGWVQYNKQALYVPFDITKQLKAGNNTIGVALGNGFYYIPRDKRYRKMTGAYGHPKMICRLNIEYSDGTTANIVSDESWKTAPSPVIFTSVYAGEDYDANLEQPGWDKPDFDASQWKNVVLVYGPPVLNAQAADPLKIMQEFTPISRKQINATSWVFDLGQNASGIPQIMVQGKKGDTVKIWPGELIHPDGTVNQTGSGRPNYDQYILKGIGQETWHPQFSYYGFRYLQIDGTVPQGEPNPNNLPVLIGVKGLHTRNAAGNIGSFSSSNELFNQTFTLIDWSMKSNMASVFTDCPHREKLGWLEQDHLVGNSIRYNYDIHRLALKCINDMKLAQTPEGLIPEVAPEYNKFGEPFRDSPEWGSSSIILPWYVYQWYGDKNALVESYDMMKRYLAYLSSKANDNILTQGLGDWYDQGPKPPGFSQLTPKGLTATAFYYYDLSIVTQVANLLGKKQDAAAYAKLAAIIKSAYNKAFFNAKTKQYGTGSQTANSISLYMGLVDEKDKKEVVDNIVADLKSRDNAITSGDIGFRYLLKALDEGGRADVIYAMNNRSDVPGYGYQIAKGATALTESWGALPQNSNNHFMLGDIMEWFYEGLAGIRNRDGSLAMKRFEIKPEVVGDMTSAKASYLSPYGEIKSDWIKEGNVFSIAVQVPVNIKAVLYLPSAQNSTITEGGKSVKSNRQFKVLGFKDGRTAIEIGSGEYHFAAK